jgi:D-arabinose 1-dehydrogenase-like Zn-dependent alcohol dehydrogenase
MRSIKEWMSGIATDSEDTLRFSEQAGVRAMVEKVPLREASFGFERMLSGKARFRVVLMT